MSCKLSNIASPQLYGHANHLFSPAIACDMTLPVLLNDSAKTAASLAVSPCFYGLSNCIQIVNSRLQLIQNKKKKNAK